MFVFVEYMSSQHRVKTQHSRAAAAELQQWRTVHHGAHGCTQAQAL
jgi:hypothetical protein